MMPACLVCANPDLNLVDGSSIWAQTLCLVLAETGLVDVHLLAKSRPERDTLFGPLFRHPRVRVIDGTEVIARQIPPPRRLSHVQMADVAQQLDESNRYDIVVVRGFDIAASLLQAPDVLRRCWLYLTDIPHSIDDIEWEQRKRLADLAEKSRRVLCQSSGLRGLWRQVAPRVPDGRYALYPPVVPDMPDDIRRVEGRPPVAIYAGKFTEAWKTLEMVEAWPAIRDRVPDARLVVIGDKFHDSREIDDYPGRMRRALEGTPGVEWRGAMPREAVQGELEAARVGLSWRDESLDASLEYSTKVLEYGRAGCAAVLNRTPMHETLLGEDYPLFANDSASFREAVARALLDDEVAGTAARRVQRTAAQHTFGARVRDVRKLLREDVPTAFTSQPVTAQRAPGSPCRVLVSGHDLKFFRGLQGALEATGRFEFTVDRWDGHNRHDERRSRSLLQNADIIVCEWALGNLCWYSQNKRPGQRLVTRLHLQERDLDYIHRATLEAVDHMVFVGPHVRDEVLAKVAFPRDRTSVVSNFMDAERFGSTKKMGDSAFTLGMIGVSPRRKRFDLAVDTLEALLARDDRYRLRVKGRHPFDHGWLKNRPDEVEHYRRLFRRINGPSLRYGVIFDPPGSDVPEWLRFVGFVLSPSDFESFHLAVGEGMLTGSIPVVWDWEGARELWPEEAIVRTPEEAADRIESVRQSGRLDEGREHARRFVLDRHGPEQVIEQWERVLLGRAPCRPESVDKAQASA